MNAEEDYVMTPDLKDSLLRIPQQSDPICVNVTLLSNDKGGEGSELIELSLPQYTPPTGYLIRQTVRIIIVDNDSEIIVS